MRVEQLGDGEPNLAVVGSIHGDEPCGAHAIEALLEADPDLERPVKLIIANERALDRNVRYTETDLNRVFPGNPDAPAYETQLAHELLHEIRGCTTLSMHSTQSYSQPFAIVDETGPLARTICPHLSIEVLVETGGFVENTLVGYVDVIEVECGLQGSAEATENAAELVEEFLAAAGALSGPIESETNPIPVYQLQRQIPKDPGSSYAVHVENFERVDAGAPYATHDETEMRAEEPFYPVLMSSHGYERQLGYAADRSGTL